MSDPFPLKPGAYYVGVVVREAATRHVIDWWDGGTNLYVEAGTEVSGQFYMPHTWRVIHSDETTPSRPRVIIPNAITSYDGPDLTSYKAKRSSSYTSVRQQRCISSVPIAIARTLPFSN